MHSTASLHSKESQMLMSCSRALLHVLPYLILKSNGTIEAVEHCGSAVRILELLGHSSLVDEVQLCLQV
jgi:hypothetical protein